MIFKLCYIITEVLLYFVTLDWITLGRIKRRRWVSLTCGAILVAMEMVLIKDIGEEDAVGKTIFVMLCLVWMFIYLCVTDHSQGLLYKFSMIIATVVIDTIYAVLLTLPSSYLCLWIAGNRNMKVVRIFFMVVYIITSVLIEHHGQKLPLYKVFDNRGIRFITTAVGICIIVLQQIGFHLAQSQYRNLSILIANFLIFTIIIGILWLLDHYRLAAGKLKVEQDNRRMNTSLHKTKELMPLLISVVNENEGLLDPQLVEEFNQIYSEQMIAGRKDSMNYKLLGTTGIKLLDAQLQHYILECSKKGIVMDVFASEPTAKQIHEMGIAQLMVHNVAGDLLRNAIRAITRDGRTDGKILVIVGKKNETVEIDIFDNGANLPLEVLERFGTRGVTTGGTGNGLADLVEMLTAENISLVIRENAGENSTYTKGFLLVFDGKNRRELITWRADEPALRQNDYWDIKELTE